MKRAWALGLLLGAGVERGLADDRRPVPFYTNEDLERMTPLRDQTGVASVPAGEGEPPAPVPRPSGRGEQFWRREAERVRTQVGRLLVQASALRQRIQSEKRRVPGRKRVRSGLPALQARLEAIVQRARTLQANLEDRARREGALPGWLR
jgi:hypothetical protein